MGSYSQHHNDVCRPYSAYIVKSSTANWEVIQKPVEFWYSTAAMLLSSLTLQLALRAFKQREMKQYRLLMAATVVLGIVFIALQWSAFNWMWDNGVRFKGASQGQFLYIIAGLHALHVLGGIVALIIMTFKAFFGKTKNYSPVAIEVMSAYWHFVDILWIYLLVFFIYLG